MQRPTRLILILILVTATIFTQPADAGWFKRTQTRFKQSLQVKPEAVPNNPQGLADSYIETIPNRPGYIGSNNLTGLENQRQKFGVTLLSPDKTRFATVETLFLPDLSYQSYSKIWLMPVGPLPEKQAYYRPYPIEKPPNWASRFFFKSYTPPQWADQVDAEAFWKRYQPEHQQAQGQVLLEAKPTEQADGEVGHYNLLDWSADGQNLLATYQLGKHHLGIYQTVPTIINIATGQVQHLRYLSRLASSTYWQNIQGPKLQTDIRVLGYQQDNPNEIVLRLVGFKPEETTLAFYRYDLNQGTLTPINLQQLAIAQNGWLVRLKAPKTQRQDPVDALPEETPQAPQAPQYLKPKTFWLN